MIKQELIKSKKEKLTSEFGLLCWNIYKQNDKIRFNNYLESLLREHKVDLIAFQEVKINMGSKSFLNQFHLSFAPNIKIFNNIYGVMNGACIPEIKTFSLLSKHKESVLATHKSAVFSSYKLKNGETLLLVNLHAINFRGTNVYNKEMDQIIEVLRHHEGAMIVAGDFNSWNKKRMETLSKLAHTLHLQSVTMDHGHLIKSFMRHKLDHIFYRGIELKDSHVIDTAKHSDHNALYARFRISEK
ncbi:endonuclease/exonuclease/phosphatase family protein [Sulfurimonas sp.]|uniref:endonuclease/exonuclease/phosphatase family protein n=1 Tax=Sulfurimonas sp. TaxID=2022749 RepID=UPI0025D7FA34|nr:endonuclease/exonuclease/phosphatase family protein [Sulfurimonas sp.]MDD5158058.1 endonuclease/exonuclease/phosphatase family protein [Sulfurimonas sp.]